MSEPRETYYEILRKGGEKEIYKVIKIFAGYNTTKEEKYKREVVFYDNDDNLLRLSKVILSTDTIGNKRKLVLERDIENNPNKKFIKMFEKYKFEKETDAKSEPSENLNFLGYSLARCFTEPLTFDPDSLFKKVKPKMFVNFKSQDYKMVNIKGFKARLTVESVVFKNVETKRENYVDLLRIAEEPDSKYGEEYFEELNKRITKQCKFLLEIDESIYKHSFRMTKKLEKPKEE